MSNTAFALSPISARATSPTDADFDAIREAFVETARGRWFLEEYTKRNRNADTALVLDAVARIERTLAAQKEMKAEEPPAPPAPDLTETLAAIKAIVAAARNSAEAALSGPPMEEALAPARKCARVIREIAWGLREAGADGRICSLLDSQVQAINAACDQIPTSDLRDSVLGAFDRAVANIDQLNASGKTETASHRDISATAEEAQSAAHEAPDNVVAFSPAASAPSPAAEASPANTSRAEVEVEAPVASETLAIDVQASEQDAAPVETMETVALTPSQADVAELVDTQEQEPAIQSAELVGDTAVSDTVLPEQTPLEAVAAEAPIAADLTSEASDTIALDESLFDLTVVSEAQAGNEVETSVEVQDTTSLGVESSAAIEAPVEAKLEMAASEEEFEQPTSALEPEIAASEPELYSLQEIEAAVIADETTSVPQLVESLEAMADVAIEETAPDEVLADYDAPSEAFAVVAQDQLSSDDALQIVEPSVDSFATEGNFEAALSVKEPSPTFDLVSETPSEDAPSMAPDEVPSTPAKTPLPDIMIGGTVATDAYATASMDMPVAMETALVSTATQMMSFAADATSDAATPSVSLGASLIANGIVPQPDAPRNDPLAAVRRMTHAERIAFFS